MRSAALITLLLGGGAIALSARKSSSVGFTGFGKATLDAIKDASGAASDAVESGVDLLASLPRGIRNNNPGNIELGDPWQGRADNQSDGRFIQFISPEYGIRALGKLLWNYQRNSGLNTVREIINRWAPPVENDTEAYVKAVAAQLGVSPDEPISVLARLSELVPAIIKHENGTQPYTREQIAAGIALI